MSLSLSLSLTFDLVNALFANCTKLSCQINLSKVCKAHCTLIQHTIDGLGSTSAYFYLLISCLVLAYVMEGQDMQANEEIE